MNNASPIPAHLASLLADLPPESLRVLEQFARFLHEQARQGQAIQPAQKGETSSYLHPTIVRPAASLNRWLDLVPEGYVGDALTNTEDLYDES
ncbi:MAG: hypothetical protein J7601_09395 [Chloroflexi bacterium]|jgi:hypothetical protein|nr:hypothetical protein [Chloroflexota bacterium]